METSSQARPFARPDLRAGLFGLDPRTHLLAVVAFGVASIVLTGLLETASASCRCRGCTGCCS